jgi:hypothetical protein
MDREKKYKLSFTAASLRMPEMSELARSILNKEKDADIREKIIKSQNTRTADRKFRELKFRVDTLTDYQLEILAHGDVLSRKHIALLGVCKLYTFLRDFTVEVLREKSLVYDYQMTDGDYITFFRRKSEVHPELEEMADSTAKKIKQVTFKILEQAGLIDNPKSKKINPQIVDDTVTRAVVQDDPEWLKIFLLPDLEIAKREN